MYFHEQTFIHSHLTNSKKQQLRPHQDVQPPKPVVKKLIFTR